MSQVLLRMMGHLREHFLGTFLECLLVIMFVGKVQLTQLSRLNTATITVAFLVQGTEEFEKEVSDRCEAGVVTLKPGESKEV